MQNYNPQNQLSRQLFYVFITLHVLCWTVIPYLVRYNLPLDSIEGAVWGHQLEWGYDKNPFLNGWLTALAIYLGNHASWPIYFFSQLSVLLCFLAVFLLAKRMLPPFHALLAVLLLETIQYYNFHAIDFNDNTLELSTWALTIYFFYSALHTKEKKLQNSCYWLATGFFAALGLMAKYYTLALLAGLFLFLITEKSARQQLKTWPLYLGFLFFLAIITPHIIWLFHHDFITVHYLFERTNSERSWFDHFFFPAQFALQQFEALLPAFIIFVIFWACLKTKSGKQQKFLSAYDSAFLFYVGLGPFLLTLLLASVSGIKLRAGWGMPLFSLLGVILFSTIKQTIPRKAVLYFTFFISLFMGLLLTAYAFSLLQARTKTSANFPGETIAQTITMRFQQKYHQRLQYVAGPRWLSGNISFYSPDHPAVFMEWNKQKSPWINLAALRKTGGVFIWEIGKEPTLSTEIQQQYPQLEGFETLVFAWRRGSTHLPPIKLGVAYLPPGVLRQ